MFRIAVRLGQGDIADRLSEHRNDSEVMSYGNQRKPLRVTWAVVAEAYRSGVERFLAETLTPQLGERYPDVPPIEVNLPDGWP